MTMRVPENAIDIVGWAILQALHEGVEDGPQSWSDMASDQEKRIKKAAVAAIEAVTDLSQYKAQGFSWPDPMPLQDRVSEWQPIETAPQNEPVLIGGWRGRQWTEAVGYIESGDRIDPFWTHWHPRPAAPPLIAEQETK